jgi:hypothetical protein
LAEPACLVESMNMEREREARRSHGREKLEEAKRERDCVDLTRERDIV